MGCYIGIHWCDYEKYGCPNCGCDYAISSIRFGNEVPAICGECKTEFMLLPNNQDVATIGVGENSYHPRVIEHPRVNIPKHKYKAPDIRPEGVGEYFKPRGIGYDLAAFVKSKEAGERVIDMFKNVLDRPIKTWLDYRPSEPNWIQVKVQKEDVDLDKLYDLTEKTGIITEEIIRSVKI